MGVGEYSIKHSLNIAKMPLSPRSFGQPKHFPKPSAPPTTPFVKWGTLSNEIEERDILQWLYTKEEENTQQESPKLPTEIYGRGESILHRMGYEGQGPIGLRKERIIEPIQPSSSSLARNTKGLGYKDKGKAKANACLVEMIHNLQEDSDIDSSEYEWDELTKHSYDDKDIDTIQTYSPYREGQTLIHRPLDCDSPIPKNTTFKEGSSSIAINNLEESTIPNTIPTNTPSISIQTINESNLSSDSLPLMHPELINWDLQGTLQLDMFQNDDAYIDYMELRDHLPTGDHKYGFAIELNIMAYFREGAKPSSRKNIKIKTGSDGENYFAAVSDPKIVKIKDASDGWNPIVAPDDGRLDTLSNDMYQEKS